MFLVSYARNGLYIRNLERLAIDDDSTAWATGQAVDGALDSSTCRSEDCNQRGEECGEVPAFRG